MKRMIFQDCQVTDFNKGIGTGVEVDKSGSMSLGDIIVRHNIKQ